MFAAIESSPLGLIAPLALLVAVSFIAGILLRSTIERMDRWRVRLYSTTGTVTRREYTTTYMRIIRYGFGPVEAQIEVLHPESYLIEVSVGGGKPVWVRTSRYIYDLHIPGAELQAHCCRGWMTGKLYIQSLGVKR